MQYTDTTLALYNDLFRDAHTQLVKEARVRGMLGRARKAIFGQSKAEAVEAARLAEREAAAAAAAPKIQDAEFARTLAERQSARYGKELEALQARPGALTEATEGLQSARSGRNLAIGAGALGVGAGVPAAYALGQNEGAEDKTRTRNLAFGAGAATGLAAPQLIRGLGSIARGANQSGLFPELAGSGYGY